VTAGDLSGSYARERGNHVTQALGPDDDEYFNRDPDEPPPSAPRASAANVNGRVIDTADDDERAAIAAEGTPSGDPLAGPRVELNPNGYDGEGVGFRAPAGLRDEVASVGPVPLVSPTAEAPLRGLVFLSRVAIVGRTAILAQAALPIAYVWQDIAVAGTIVLLAGAPGDGKTTLLFLLIAARACVGDAVALLGRRVEPAPAAHFIVIIEGEHGEGSACRKLKKSMELLGIDDCALDRIILIARKAVHIGSPEWNEVVRQVRAGIVSDIVIDTVARVMPSDGSSEHEQVALFDTIAKAIDTAPTPEDRPVVWAAAHTKKNGQSGELSDVSGSVQRTGQADTVLLLRAERADGRVVGSNVVFAKLREDPDDYPSPTVFRIVKDAEGHQTVMTEATSCENEKAPNITVEAVLAVFSEKGAAGLSTTMVRRLVAQARGCKEGAKADAATIERHLKTLVARGDISPCTIAPRNGKTFEGWRAGSEGGTVAGVHRKDIENGRARQEGFADHLDRAEEA